MERLIGDTLKTFGIGGALLAATFAVAFWFFNDLHKQQGKGWWIALLRHDGLARRYRSLMAAAPPRPAPPPGGGKPTVRIRRQTSACLPVFAPRQPKMSAVIPAYQPRLSSKVARRSAASSPVALMKLCTEAIFSGVGS